MGSTTLIIAQKNQRTRKGMVLLNVRIGVQER